MRDSLLREVENRWPCSRTAHKPRLLLRLSYPPAPSVAPCPAPPHPTPPHPGPPWTAPPHLPRCAQVSFGVFDTEEGAARQYDRALILEKVDGLRGWLAGWLGWVGV